MRITVVGSINLDLVATAPRLPAPGETVTGATLARYPGGKGANQAYAAEKLGAEVSLIGRVGNDSLAGEALSLMSDLGVDLAGVETDVAAPTGVALIAVDPTGENQIVVAAGANHLVTPEQLPQRIEGALIVQLELPIETVEAAVGRATGFVCANLAPAAPVSDALLRRADLIVVNETEAAFYGDGLHRGGGRVVVTKGARGAAMYQRGVEMAWATPPTGRGGGRHRRRRRLRGRHHRGPAGRHGADAGPALRLRGGGLCGDAARRPAVGAGAA
jgi:ribokinase